MTAVIYDHDRKQIATDSRLTRNGQITSDSSIKYIESGGRVYFFSGSVSDMARSVEILDSSINGDVAGIKSPVDSGVIFYDKGNAFLAGICDDGAVWEEELFCNMGNGSGSQWALAALDHDKTAKQAIKYAATKDAYTGGLTRVFDVIKGRFIRG